MAPWLQPRRSRSATPACTLGGAPVAHDVTFTSNIASRFVSPSPGVLANVTNTSGLPLTAVGTGLNSDGSFAATGPASACPTLVPPAPTGASCVQFPYQAKNSQGTLSNTANATVVFLPASNLVVHVKDAKTGLAIK